MNTVTYKEIHVGTPEHKQELALRGRVLRGELGRPPVPEIFPWDDQSRRYVALADGAVIACLLVHPRDGLFKVFQMAVEPHWRGTGVGPKLMKFLLAEERKKGTTGFFLHARHYVVHYYAGFGFEPAGEPFEEIGIPHQRMELRFPNDPQRSDG